MKITSATAARKMRWLVPYVIVTATATAFLPALQNGFVNWDDDGNFLNNPHYRGLGWQQLVWMFTTFHLGPYQPLSWLTLGLDYLIWGMNPFGYHLTNLLLHAANAVVFYFVAARLLSLAFSSSREESSIILGASLAALLFAIHPLRVESVAWVTERRDVLSGLFFLLAVQFYLTAATTETPARYKKWLALTLVVFVLSLLSKAVAVTLPVVLLVLDVYPLGRVGRVNRQWFAKANRTIWIEKIPFVLVAAVAGWVALLGQYSAGAARSLEHAGLIARVAQVFYGLVFYAAKTFVPIGLSPLYELPEKLSPLDWPYLASGIVVITMTAALFLLRRRWPAGLAVWVCYVALVAPVSGIVPTGPQLVAQRYSYLSCLGWALLAGGGVIYLRNYLATPGRVLAGALSLVLALIGLGRSTWQQAKNWHDSESLWRYAVTLDPESSIARNQLGNALADSGELEAAIEQYRHGLQVKPTDAGARNQLGNALASRGALEEAIEQYRQALRIRPTYAGAHYNLAMALADRGDLEGAMRHYEAAVRFDPANANARNNLGALLARRGELDAAIEHYQRALELRPEFAEARDNLSRALAIRSRREQANR